MKIDGKSVNKRMIDGFLKKAWQVRLKVLIQQLNMYTFKLGFLDRADYERIIKAHWDWFEDIVTMREWKS